MDMDLGFDNVDEHPDEDMSDEIPQKPSVNELMDKWRTAIRCITICGWFREAAGEKEREEQEKRQEAEREMFLRFPQMTLEEPLLQESDLQDPGEPPCQLCPSVETTLEQFLNQAVSEKSSCAPTGKGGNGMLHIYSTGQHTISGSDERRKLLEVSRESPEWDTFTSVLDNRMDSQISHCARELESEREKFVSMKTHLERASSDFHKLETDVETFKATFSRLFDRLKSIVDQVSSNVGLFGGGPSVGNQVLGTISRVVDEGRGALAKPIVHQVSSNVGLFGTGPSGGNQVLETISGVVDEGRRALAKLVIHKDRISKKLKTLQKELVHHEFAPTNLFQRYAQSVVLLVQTSLGEERPNFVSFGTFANWHFEETYSRRDIESFSDLLYPASDFNWCFEEAGK